MTHLLTAYLTMLPHNFSRSWSARKVIHISSRQISGKLPEHTTRKAVKSLSIAASSRDPWSQAIGKHIIIIAMEQHILSILHTEQEFTCCLTDNIKVSASGRKERHNVLLTELLFPFQYRRHQSLDLRNTHHIWHSQSLNYSLPVTHFCLANVQFAYSALRNRLRNLRAKVGQCYVPPDVSTAFHTGRGDYGRTCPETGGLAAPRRRPSAPTSTCHRLGPFFARGTGMLLCVLPSAWAPASVQSARNMTRIKSLTFLQNLDVTTALPF